MSAARRIARDMARAQSYRQNGNTDLFDYYFKKIWREKAGHPEGRRWNPTKPMFVRALLKVKNKLAKAARKNNRRK